MSPEQLAAKWATAVVDRDTDLEKWKSLMAAYLAGWHAREFLQTAKDNARAKAMGGGRGGGYA